MFLAFQESLSENSLKVLFNKTNWPDNCEIAPEKMVNPAIFSTVSFSTKNTDKKVQEVQRNMSKMTACFINLSAQLPAIFQIHSRTEKSKKTDIFEICLDGLKVAEQGDQYLTQKKLSCEWSHSRIYRSANICGRLRITTFW